MTVDYDSTSAYCVFKRLAQLQDETRKRLIKIDYLMDAQAKNDEEFSELEKIARRYLEPLGYPAVVATAFDCDRPYITQDYTIVMDDTDTIVRPTIDVFSILSLEPNEVDAILKTDGATESAFEMAMEKAIGECEVARENDADTSEDD